MHRTKCSEGKARKPLVEELFFGRCVKRRHGQAQVLPDAVLGHGGRRRRRCLIHRWRSNSWASPGRTCMRGWRVTKKSAGRSLTRIVRFEVRLQACSDTAAVVTGAITGQATRRQGIPSIALCGFMPARLNAMAPISMPSVAAASRNTSAKPASSRNRVSDFDVNPVLCA